MFCENCVDHIYLYPNVQPRIKNTLPAHCDYTRDLAYYPCRLSKLYFHQFIFLFPGNEWDVCYNCVNDFAGDVLDFMGYLYDGAGCMRGGKRRGL